MRAVVASLPLLILVACSSQDASTDPGSVRDRLATDTHLFIAASDSAGAVTAQMRSGTGWEDGLVDLKLEGGELVARASRGGAIALSALALELQTITIPATVIGHEAQLSRPRLQLTAPVELTATWNGDDDAQVDASLSLELSWSLTVDGVGLPLGAPSLPPLPVKLGFTGDGVHVTAELRVHAPGELWNWADLIKLSDLELVLGADTPES
ncbi:MAG TPA: hypothetical protein VIX73_33865 [Kofleriaceae bacterium]|jgi:hypothetical protein